MPGVKVPNADICRDENVRSPDSPESEVMVAEKVPNVALENEKALPVPLKAGNCMSDATGIPVLNATQSPVADTFVTTLVTSNARLRLPEVGVIVPVAVKPIVPTIGFAKAWPEKQKLRRMKTRIAFDHHLTKLML